MERTVVHKPFNADGSFVDVVVETYVNGAIVEYPKPAPHIVLSVDKSQIIADGVDESLLSVVFESCSLADNEIVWSRVIPTGDVTFTINLRPTTVSIDAVGKALLALSTTVAGMYRIVASFPGYGEATAVVEAMV